MFVNSKCQNSAGVSRSFILKANPVIIKIANNPGQPRMSFFDYTDYKALVNDWVTSQPRQGYGLYSKIAEALGTNSVIISQVFRSTRDLNLEQAAKLSAFMGLSQLESDYLLLLVQLARAGTHELRKIFERQLQEVRTRGQTIRQRIQHQELSDEDKAVFYSSWLYLATWLGASVPGLASVHAIAQRFQVPEERISGILRFLTEHDLLVKKGGRFELGEKVIHVAADSPHVIRHHLNWRMKALQSMDRARPEDLHYSAPMALSKDLVPKIREELAQLIQKQTKRVADSPSETLMCLNLDWFAY